MSIWDDISGAFEDLFDYIDKGMKIMMITLIDGVGLVYIGVETAWRKTKEIANTVADAIKELGITLSQGLIDGANVAIGYLEKNVKVLPGLIDSKHYETYSACNLSISKAIGAVFLRIAVEGEEYDVFAPLSMACDEAEKNPVRIKAAVNIAADRIGNDIYNIPKVAEVVKKKDALKDYLAWIIYKAAIENPQLMAGGKSGQALTGMVTVAMSNLICEGTVAAGAPAWPDTSGKADPINPLAPTVWAEGTRLYIGDDIYLVLDGKVRHIPDPATYSNLFEDWNNIIRSEPGLQLIDKPLTPGAYLSSAVGDSKIYLVNDGVKRWISSQQVFGKYHFNPKTVKQQTPAVQNDIPTGNAIYQFVKREGSLLDMKPDGGIYLLLDKTACHIPNPATFNQLFKNWNSIREVSMHSVPIGVAISDGAYLASAETKVYFVNGGQKRWIMSPIAFNNFYFDWSKIRKVSVADLEKIPEGKSIY